MQPSSKPPNYIEDSAQGFSGLLDRVLRGRSNKTILNTSVGLSALDVGIPSEASSIPFDVPAMLINNFNAYMPGEWGTTLFSGEHPLFSFEADNLTLFGLDIPNFIGQFRGEPSEHIEPLFTGENGQSLAEAIGLPDLPYMEMAHFAHLGMALYDTGRTFQDVWRELGDYYEKNKTDPTQQGLGLAAHLGKTITHPEMLHTLAARGVMLTVMGLLHPLGGVIAIGVAYLCAHLVHSAYGVMERNKEAIQKVENVPVLGAIYNASGIKEWAERDVPAPQEPVTQAERVDPYQELELTPERAVHQYHREGRLDELMAQLRTQTA